MKTYHQFLVESKKIKIDDFVNFVKNYLNIVDIPKIEIIDNPEFSMKNKTFGSFDMKDNTICVQVAQRHPMDIYRTLAHELVHYKQRKSGREMNGDDGSDTENEANSTAAIILRQYSKKITNHGY